VEARVLAGRGDYYKALAAMESAIALAPSRQLRLERALYLLLAGLPRRAMEAADSELLLNKADPLASLVKGMALYTLKDKPGAAEYLSRAGGGEPFTAKIAASFLAAPVTGTGDSCKK
jgi:tetratricopeptide (TPR) repeat protein